MAEVQLVNQMLVRSGSISFVVVNQYYTSCHTHTSENEQACKQCMQKDLTTTSDFEQVLSNLIAWITKRCHSDRRPLPYHKAK